MPTLFKSFKNARRGLKAVLKEERNFLIEICFAILALLISAILKFSLLEFLFIVVAIAMVLGAEILNTIVEDVCDKIDPTENKIIGKIKDMAAGFVLLFSLASIIIGVVIVLHHIFV